MARSALSILVLASPLAVALVAQGCTQDFGTFDPSGAGGSGPSTGPGPGPGSGTPSASSSSSSGTPASSGTDGTGAGTPATGTGGGGGDTTGGGGAGVPTDCTVPDDCDDDNPCTDDACVEAACVYTPVPDAILDDSPDDCRRIECVGGEFIDEPADEDPVDAFPPCELTICVDGVPTPDYATEGTSCGPSPQECDGTGQCTGCDPTPPDQDECGAPTDCSAPDCVAPGVCDPGFLPDTTDVADPDAGDCQTLACTGQGAQPISVADDTDEPPDFPCGDRTCSGGTPSTSTLANGIPCLGMTGVCDGAGTAASNCKVCRDTANGAGQDAGCMAPTPICNPAGNGTCVACFVDGGGNDVGCGDGLRCVGGECIECEDDGDCPGQVCDLNTNTCEDCWDDGALGADPGCDNDLDPVCDEGTRSCTGCVVDDDCDDNVRGGDCRSDTDQCGCQNAGDCPASFPDCNSFVCE